MKTTIRIPTADYAYFEQEFDHFMSPDDAAAKYRELMEAYKGREGLPHLEWNKALDKYLNGDGTEPDTYAEMSLFQQGVIQELKKAFKRIK